MEEREKIVLLSIIISTPLVTVLSFHNVYMVRVGSGAILVICLLVLTTKDLKTKRVFELALKK